VQQKRTDFYHRRTSRPLSEFRDQHLSKVHLWCEASVVPTRQLQLSAG